MCVSHMCQLHLHVSVKISMQNAQLLHPTSACKVLKHQQWSSLSHQSNTHIYARILHCMPLCELVHSTCLAVFTASISAVRSAWTFCCHSCSTDASPLNFCSCSFAVRPLLTAMSSSAVHCCRLTVNSCTYRQSQCVSCISCLQGLDLSDLARQ